MLELSHSLGNSALLDLLAARPSGAEATARPLPQSPCETAPAEFAAGGTPVMAEPPAFAAMAPMAATAPMAV